MGHSPLLGADPAPLDPSGRETGRLGPSDNSDSGSDVAGLELGDESLPLEEALQEAVEEVGADIAADRVIDPHRRVRRREDGDAEVLSDDEDADLAFIDRAEAGDPLDDEPEDEPDAPERREPGRD